MSHKEKPQQELPAGVRKEHGEYIVEVTWKNGKTAEWHIPQGGLIIHDKSGKDIGGFDAKKAIEIILKEALNTTFEEFSWEQMLKKEGGQK